MTGDQKQTISAQPGKGSGLDFLLVEEGREAGDLPNLTLALIGGTHVWEDAVARVLEEGVRAIDNFRDAPSGPFTRAMDYALEDAGFFTVEAFDEETPVRESTAQEFSFRRKSPENNPAYEDVHAPSVVGQWDSEWVSYDITGDVIDLVPQDNEVL